MSTSDWHDDEEPLAPLPAHEREWRHPSEVGAHDWLLSEPPLALGRGLVLTTTVVITLLALAVLWTTIPTRAGRGVALTDAASVVSLTTGIVLLATGRRVKAKRYAFRPYGGLQSVGVVLRLRF